MPRPYPATLALAIGRQRDAFYLDLEDSIDRSRLSEPALFLESVEDRLVILDEIHRVPELFQVLREPFWFMQVTSAFRFRAHSKA